MGSHLKDKKCVFHLHGNLDIWKWKNNPVTTALSKKMKIVSCSPITETVIKGSVWLPNPLPTHEKRYLPVHKDWHGALKIIHTVIHEYNKGTEDLKHVFNYLKDECHMKIEPKILNRSHELEAALDVKKQHHVCIDNITQGFIGMAGWEAMALKLSCIARLDPYVKKRYKEVLSPNEELPIIDVNGIDQMAQEIVELWQDTEYRSKQAEKSRLWMEKHYNIQKITDIWVEFYENLVKEK